MNNKVKLIMEDGSSISVNKDTRVSDIINNYLDYNTIGVRINGKAAACDYEISEDSFLQLIDVNSRIGKKMYIKGLEFVYLLAIQELYGDYTKVSIKHSLDKSLYTELNIGKTINESDVRCIKDKMREIVSLNLPINKISASRIEVINYLEKLGEGEKVLNYKYMTNDIISLYELKDIYNDFYYILPVSTGILNKFNLTYVHPNGIVLSYPVNGVVPKYKPSVKVFDAFKSYNDRLSKLGINYASDINKLVVQNKIRDYIQINEMIYDENVNDIVKIIIKNPSIKSVFISGPSSSGKTTTSKKLSLALKSKGIESFTLSTDDYYLNRVDNPKDSEGNYDYETVEALDYKLFSKDLEKLLKYEEVKMPTFNFVTGEKEFKKPAVKINQNTVVIVEGLHAINEKLNGLIPKKNKLKIYISPFTPVSVDRHNHISTTDLRLLRRMVRDYRCRGYSGNDTLETWINMRKSEEENIYPYQRYADIVLNTSISYEIGVLKTYAEPLLYSIDISDENYEEAVRILNFLKGFINIPGEYVPNTSVIREFIGNSYFE